jgi:hypothetical protein
MRGPWGYTIFEIHGDWIRDPAVHESQSPGSHVRCILPSSQHFRNEFIQSDTLFLEYPATELGIARCMAERWKHVLEDDPGSIQWEQRIFDVSAAPFTERYGERLERALPDPQDQDTSSGGACGGCAPKSRRPPGDPFRFLELPTELRTQIYSYFIETGCVFYFHSASHRACPSDRRTVFTKIRPASKPLPQASATPILLLNRQVRDECYSMMYGENTFVFEEVSRSVGPTTFSSDTAKEVQFWTKPVRSAEHRSLCMLNENTVKFARRLEIIVAPIDKKTYGDYKALQRSMERIAAKLSLCTTLRSLHITVSRQHDTYIPRCRIERYARLDHAARVRASEHGAPSLRMEPLEPKSTWRLPDERKQFVLEPLAAVSGLRHVTIDGFIDPDFARKLSAVMMSKDSVKPEVSPLTTATVEVFRKRRSTSQRKTRYEVPARKYWEPTLNWEAFEAPQS